MTSRDIWGQGQTVHRREAIGQSEKEREYQEIFDRYSYDMVICRAQRLVLTSRDIWGQGQTVHRREAIVQSEKEREYQEIVNRNSYNYGHM